VHRDDVKIVETDRIIVHPVECPVPIILEKDLPIAIREETTHIMPVVQVVEKIVRQIEEKIIVEPVEVHHEIPVIQEEVRIVEKEKYLVQTKYEEVRCIEEKVVEVVNTIERIKEVPVVYEKLIPLIKELPKIFEFQKDAKIIPAPPQIEIIEKIKPYIVNVNNYVERIVEKLVEVPYLLRETSIQELIRYQTEVGPERHTKETEVRDLHIEKELYLEVEKKVIDTVHRID
jgi:hypothetical protein